VVEEAVAGTLVALVAVVAVEAFLGAFLVEVPVVMVELIITEDITADTGMVVMVVPFLEQLRYSVQLP
jgi:hypothetical protein